MTFTLFYESVWLAYLILHLMRHSPRRYPPKYVLLLNQPTVSFD
ncbi:hypothetical protein [Paenibacillus sp. YIM B09110]